MLFPVVTFNNKYIFSLEILLISKIWTRSSLRPVLLSFRARRLGDLCCFQWSIIALTLFFLYFKDFVSPSSNTLFKEILFKNKVIRLITEPALNVQLDTLVHHQAISCLYLFYWYFMGFCSKQLATIISCLKIYEKAIWSWILSMSVATKTHMSVRSLFLFLPIFTPLCFESTNFAFIHYNSYHGVIAYAYVFRLRVAFPDKHETLSSDITF